MIDGTARSDPNFRMSRHKKIWNTVSKMDKCNLTGFFFFFWYFLHKYLSKTTQLPLSGALPPKTAALQVELALN